MLSLIVFAKGFSRIRDAILFEDYVLLFMYYYYESQKFGYDRWRLKLMEFDCV